MEGETRAARTPVVFNRENALYPKKPTKTNSGSKSTRAHYSRRYVRASFRLRPRWGGSILMNKTVAIIGLGARFPGAPDLSADRRLLRARRVERSPLPADLCHALAAWSLRYNEADGS